jgi:hypothetical protein
MKKLSFPISVVILLTFASGCNKSNNKTPASSEWTFLGTTFKGYTTNYDSISRSILSQDSLGNKIDILFTLPPKVNSQYVAISDWADSVNKGYYATIAIRQANSIYNYVSTGKAGDILNVTIIDKKVQVTFSNSTVSDISDTTTTSGTLIQLTP